MGFDWHRQCLKCEECNKVLNPGQHAEVREYFDSYTKVIYPKYSKHWPYTVPYTIHCVCSKMLNHGLNHGLFLSLFKLIPCHIHWIVSVLAYLNFIFEFYFKAALALPKTAGSAQTHKSISFIWIVWSTLYVYLWIDFHLKIGWTTFDNSN
jgi:hypothetical protein